MKIKKTAIRSVGAARRAGIVDWGKSYQQKHSADGK